MVGSVPSTSPEYPPLLPIGRHALSMSGLRLLCVDKFPLSNTRTNIMDGFETVVERLVNSNIRGEIWVDGSFLTEKLEPQDVDFVLRIEADVYDNGTREQREVINWLNDDLKSSYFCDSYWFPVYPRSHPNYGIGEDLEAYWMKQWGLSRTDNVKGIAVIELPGGGP